MRKMGKINETRQLMALKLHQDWYQSPSLILIIEVKATNISANLGEL